jgi:hypothetical protein
MPRIRPTQARKGTHHGGDRYVPPASNIYRIVNEPGYQEDIFQRGEKIDLIQVLAVSKTW